MKLLVTASALAVLMGLGAATPVSAYFLSPPQARIHLVGPVRVKVPGGSGQCEVTFVGSTGKGTKHSGRIQKGLFGGASRCFLFGTNLPWQIKVTGPSQATILNFGFASESSPCGPADVPVTIDSNGVWTFNSALPGGCRFSGSVPTNPPITIAQ